MKKKDKKKVLWIALFALYDSVPHAGGKNGNYYLKALCKEENAIRCLSFPYEREIQYLDYDKYGIEDIHKCYKDSRNRVLRLIDIYLTILKRMREFKKEGYYPDTIIIQWTELSFLINLIKRVYPKSMYVVVEEDVAFLAYKRYYLRCKNVLNKILLHVFYHTVKFLELHSVKSSNITICNNAKDKQLLIGEGISKDKVLQCVVYYQDFSNHVYNGDGDYILFYGAMNRKENSDSVLWFDDNVMPLLKDTGLRFKIIGGGVRQELRETLSERVDIEGFVEDPGEYFENALCMVVPLVLGAGIKVKILEGMKMGIPIITNTIGIEGIPAVGGIDYLHAETAEEFSEAIHRLRSDKGLREKLSNNSKRMIEEKFNYELSGREFCKVIEDL